mmetsp:Transcript_47754/g.136390  ORF Transcript_47754/g.136390 Transcript_47754/m.136390 type:complete len:238 (-) Transcript_47754:1075-1788(-)
MQLLAYGRHGFDHVCFSLARDAFGVWGCPCAPGEALELCAVCGRKHFQLGGSDDSQARQGQERRLPGRAGRGRGPELLQRGEGSGGRPQEAVGAEPHHREEGAHRRVRAARRGRARAAAGLPGRGLRAAGPGAAPRARGPRAGVAGPLRALGPQHRGAAAGRASRALRAAAGAVPGRLASRGRGGAGPPGQVRGGRGRGLLRSQGGPLPQLGPRGRRGLHAVPLPHHGPHGALPRHP